jgi:transposase InsO family protein
MIQADASEHDWLEGRGPVLTLVGMIDDATDQVVLRFYPSETTEAYMDVLRRWIERHGRPVSWYSDRHSIFRAEEKVAGYDQKQSVATQFSRALAELGIKLIPAGSPQAKGRIERLWGTAQDRPRAGQRGAAEQVHALVQPPVPAHTRQQQ